MAMTAEEIQKRLNFIAAYYLEDYQEDNVVIMNERFKNTLQFASELPRLKKRAAEIRDAKLSSLITHYKISTAKLMASKEVLLANEVEDIESLINKAHRTLQSQMSTWKAEENMYKTGGKNIT